LRQEQKPRIFPASAHRIRRRTIPPTAPDGSLVLPFERLDEPAVSWRGCLETLEACLRSQAEVDKRRRALSLLLADLVLRRLAEEQLKEGLDMMRSWLREQPEKFVRPANRLVLERVVLQLQITAQEVEYEKWPGLHWILRAFQDLASKSAPLRFSLLANLTQD